MEITRDFTATTYIVHKGKVLLHLHKKLGLWIPVGGHIEPNELPEEAAIREIKEETGLNVKFYNPDKKIDADNVQQLLRPVYILLEDISESHQHIDFFYFASSDSDNLTPEDGKITDLKWFTAEEVEVLEGAPQNVKLQSREAIKLLSERSEK